ncbi:MAG: aminopeptidase N C-terminal domain-containing protein [Alphaproteobacteria bacterium]|nr:aminopeptidase N C-terminal domain-containing protein [Alphaproteobacteria bacterium]
MTADDLRFLMVHDNDGFNRWEAGQTYALRVMDDLLDAQESGADTSPPAVFLDSYGTLLEQAFAPETDKALLARMLSLPDVSVIGQQRRTVDPTAIHRVREQIKTAITAQSRDLIARVYQENRTNGPFGVDPDSMARRALQNVALEYLDDPALAKAHYDQANNMTDRIAALGILGDIPDSDEGQSLRDDAFGDFYRRFKAYPLVIDKWFARQAMAVRPDTVQDVRRLKDHPDFIMTNPNRVRSLFAAFAMNNPVCFHAPGGSGYDFLTEAIVALNTINPQIAARLLTPFKEWRRYTPDRQEKMKTCLERIRDLPDLSPDVFEIVEKSLNA